MRRLLFILLIVAVLGSSCRTRKESYVRTDTTSVIERLVPRSVTIPPDSLQARFILQYNDLGKIKPAHVNVDSPGMMLELSIDEGGEVKAKAVQHKRTDTLYVTERIETRATHTHEVIETEIKSSAWYTRLLAKAGGIVLLVLALYVAYRLLKSKIKFKIL